LFPFFYRQTRASAPYKDIQKSGGQLSTKKLRSKTAPMASVASTMTKKKENKNENEWTDLSSAKQERFTRTPNFSEFRLRYSRSRGVKSRPAGSNKELMGAPLFAHS
jgi:Tfp pilus tip-associated adhesin PilY1